MNTTLRYLSGESVRVWMPEGAALPRVEIIDELIVLSARFKRVFPLSEPEKHLSIQDGKGREVAVLTSMKGLSPDSLQIVREQLDRRYFTPTISRIDELEAEKGMWRFQVQTQRGPAEFYVRNWRDSSHEMGAGRWQITSVDGQRYEIMQVDDLDARSQRLLEQLL